MDEERLTPQQRYYRTHKEKILAHNSAARRKKREEHTEEVRAKDRERYYKDKAKHKNDEQYKARKKAKQHENYLKRRAKEGNKMVPLDAQKRAEAKLANRIITKRLEQRIKEIGANKSDFARQHGMQPKTFYGKLKGVSVLGIAEGLPMLVDAGINPMKLYQNALTKAKEMIAQKTEASKTAKEQET